MKTILFFLLVTTIAFSQEVVTLDQIENYIGKEVTVCEVVKSTFKTEKHEISFLNFWCWLSNFFTSVLTGLRALGNGSYEKLVWHIIFVLNKMK